MDSVESRSSRMNDIELRPTGDLAPQQAQTLEGITMVNLAGKTARLIDAATRIGLTFWSRLFNWRDALTVVGPATLIRWHRACWHAGDYSGG